MKLIKGSGVRAKQMERRLSPEEKKEILASAQKRLEFSFANAKLERKYPPPEIAICEHCRNPMQFADARFCEPCGNLESTRLFSDDASEKFRVENRVMLKVLAVLLTVGFLIIWLMLKFAQLHS